MTSNSILLGKIGAAHGIRGEVRISAFTEDPLAIAAYGPLATDRPRLVITITDARVAKNVVIARLKGVADRNGAEALNGVSLYIDRDRLPETEDEDEFYHADLIGLAVRGEDGDVMGEVVTLANFGADDLLEIRLSGARQTVYLPFTRAVVPVVDIAGGHVVVVPPDGWLDETPRDPDDRDDDDGV